jgi:predicted transcriptional regulator
MNNKIKIAILEAARADVYDGRKFVCDAVGYACGMYGGQFISKPVATREQAESIQNEIHEAIEDYDVQGWLNDEHREWYIENIESGKVTMQEYRLAWLDSWIAQLRGAK